MFGLNIGIDLGTSNFIIYVDGKGIVLNEPSIVALDTETGHLVAAGENAINMLPNYLTIVQPIKNGIISNYTVTEQMIRYFLGKICKNTINMIFKPKIIVCAPCSITNIEKKAINDVLIKVGARTSTIIYSPLASAIGIGIDIEKPHGSLIVDIGGGTTDITVITLKNIALNTSIKIAGEKFNEAIIYYIRQKYNILIGELTAESIKKVLASASLRKKEISTNAYGRNFFTGLPDSCTVTSTDIYEALKEPIQAIANGITYIMEKTPPELLSDIQTDGIILTGGSSLIYGLSDYISNITNVQCHIANNPLNCTALGLGDLLKENNHLNI